MQYALITHHMGLTQIAQIAQIIFIIRLICVSQSPRGGRWAYCNNALITHRIGLTQIDLIKQIYYFFCGFRDFREKPPILSQMPQMSQNGGASLGIYHSAQNRTKTVKKKATPV